MLPAALPLVVFRRAGRKVGVQKRLVFAAFVNIFCAMYSVAGESNENAHEKSNAIQQFQPVADQRSAEPGQAPGAA
jgi:hypothetical protein